MEHSILLQKEQPKRLNNEVNLAKAPKQKNLLKGKIFNETTLSLICIGAFSLFLFSIGISLWIVLPLCLILSGSIIWNRLSKDLTIDISLDDSIANAVEQDLFNNQS